MEQLSLGLESKNKISPKLALQLGEWVELYPFFEGPGWLKVKADIKPDLDRITPPIDRWFKAFRCCPPKDLRLIWLGMSPYYTIDGYTKLPVADGLTFSTDERHAVPPSLYQVYKGIEKDLYGGLNLNMQRCNSLEYLAYQGVLLLNVCLTTTFGEAKAHIQAWKPFVDYLLDHFNKNYQGLIFVGFGVPANEALQKVDKAKHEVIELEHPAFAARQGREWAHENVFSRINGYLELQQKPTILWDRYLTQIEPPF